MQAYLTMSEIAQLLERGSDQIKEMVASGELIMVIVPGYEELMPLSMVPPITKVCQE